MFVQFICLLCSWKIACLAIRRRHTAILYASARGRRPRNVVIVGLLVKQDERNAHICILLRFMHLHVSVLVDHLQGAYCYRIHQPYVLVQYISIYNNMM